MSVAGGRERKSVSSVLTSGVAGRCGNPGPPAVEMECVCMSEVSRVGKLTCESERS